MRLDADGLRRELALRGLSQSQFAALAGVTPATLSHSLNGHHVTTTTVRKLARVIATTPVLAGAQTLVGQQKKSGVEGADDTDQAA